MAKHGDLPGCGHDYAVHESTARAYCPHCKESMPEAKDQGRIVRLTSKTMKMLYGQGGRGAPINGRIVGQAGPFPIVQWSDGMVSGISPAGIETDKRATQPNRAGNTDWIAHQPWAPRKMEDGYAYRLVKGRRPEETMISKEEAERSQYQGNTLIDGQRYRVFKVGRSRFAQLAFG